MKKLVLILFSMGTLATSMQSCREKKKDTGENVEEAIDETGDAIEEAAEETKDAAEEVTQ